ncbi:hypothetical protein ABID21_002394 [Pseudorhizobium tarimense]|uniref:Transposase n=1 Tax=Pseudorhizobium tarimense TaxID=1079109 RepID=A0ABV2H774_9HYPH|nr:hypothetical protein [Pseudorhizobium tarimense]MCJ8519389.1 hypothetical protein [Pseudorhizobium tarimense]
MPFGIVSSDQRRRNARASVMKSIHGVEPHYQERNLPPTKKTQYSQNRSLAFAVACRK